MLGAVMGNTLEAARARASEEIERRNRQIRETLAAVEKARVSAEPSARQQVALERLIQRLRRIVENGEQPAT